ncbi:MAG TPA: glutamate--tRNA ligase [Candidatus Babeliales bacterium]|nr:glutamate--tRNA ligase [Candidatus Babeliales bacterium]
MKVRTRFAPSPTGALHVGGIRTALFAWLVARQAKGQFVLRLEDTDKKREQAGAEEQIINSLKVLGLQYDEGPDCGGQFAPYRQSERLESYKQWAQKLIDKGRAYADPYTVEEVQKFRDEAQKAKKPFLYRNHRPTQPPKWNGKTPLRFQSEPKPYKWHDEVLGDLNTGPEVVDDFILIKSDGYPTYNFSHIIDDAEMEISHVIRGQEFIASTPNYLNLYEALGLERPILATMPHILGPEGKKKLSKRDGAKDVLDYIEAGYLPEALVSFISTLGWNDGTEQEIFTVEELIDKFDLKKVQRSGAKFDEQRLEWTNGHFIREMPLNKLSPIAESFWPEAAERFDEQYKKDVLSLVQERLKFMAELPQLTSFFFSEPKISEVKELFDNPTDRQLKSASKLQIKALLVESAKVLEPSDFTEKDITSRLNGLLEQLNTKPGILFAAIRIAITGSKSSPQLFGTLRVLGKDKSLERLKRAIETLRS